MAASGASAPRGSLGRSRAPCGDSHCLSHAQLLHLQGHRAMAHRWFVSQGTWGRGKWSPLWRSHQGPLSKQGAGALPTEKGRWSTRNHRYLLRCTQPRAR